MHLEALTPCRFTGATLIEAVEQLEAAKRPVAGPLRCVLFGKRTAASRVVCQGRVESGCMRPDMVRHRARLLVPTVGRRMHSHATGLQSRRCRYVSADVDAAVV